MALAHDNIDRLAEKIAALGDAQKVRLLSRLMETEGTKVDWSVICRVQRHLPDTLAQRRAVNQTVREVRRERRHRIGR